MLRKTARMRVSRAVALIVFISLALGLGGYLIGRFTQPAKEGYTLWADEWDCTQAVETNVGADCRQWTKKFDE